MQRQRESILLLLSLLFSSIIIPSSAISPHNLANESPNFFIFQENTIQPILSNHFPVFGGQKLLAIITGYSSTPDQTDQDPFMTASGDIVEDGVVANNFLPFGAKIKIPQLFGDKIFIVKDRLRPDLNKYYFDIWFKSKEEAIYFGIKIAEVEILSF